MARTICKILGAAFVLAGLAGYVMPNLAGFHLSGTHNIIHLLSGAAALYFGFAAPPAATRTFSLVLGLVYLGLGVLGFIAPDVVASLIQAHEVPGARRSLLSDNLFHVVVGALFLLGGLARAPQATVNNRGNVARG